MWYSVLEFTVLLVVETNDFACACTNLVCWNLENFLISYDLLNFCRSGRRSSQHDNRISKTLRSRAYYHNNRQRTRHVLSYDIVALFLKREKQCLEIITSCWEKFVQIRWWEFEMKKASEMILEKIQVVGAWTKRSPVWRSKSWAGSTKGEKRRVPH